jgi:type VI secretion system protein ImpK
MSTAGDDIDQPTVTRRLSPRARTALGGGDTRRGADDGGDEPTLVVQRHVGPVPEAMAAASSSLQSAARIVQQLEAMPERTLVRAAAPVLLIVAQLRNSIERADVTALRREVAEEIDRFQQDAQKAGVEAGDIIAGRYVLCSTVDETVLMTPWGSRSEWSANSLLNQYHNETWGGEKVFVILDRIRANPEKKLQLIILIHACLMLGFEGRYRVLERGRDQLEDLRNELSRTIRRYSKAKETEPLSKDASGEAKGRRLSNYVPIWMVAVGTISLLVIVNTYVEIMLTGAVTATVTKIQSLTPG